jgi:hypothetical protein
MRFFRREETLNEQLLREAGLDQPNVEARPVSATPEPARVEMPEAQTSRDVLVVARARGIASDRVQFVVLPTGDLIVETEQGDADLSPLADAIELNLQPPYRAVGNRQRGDLWGISAKALDVREFHCEEGDEIEVVCLGGTVTVTVDEKPSELRVPQLEQTGDYAVHASRIDGDYWEAEAHPL